MGFFDKLKQGAELAKKGLDVADEQMQKQASRMSDSDIKALLEKNPNNKYAREEANKRGIA